MGERQWKTACPLNCYDVCGFVVTTDNGKIKSISGDPEHPITKGKICGRGKMLKDRIYDHRRLSHPLKKVGNEFIQISWEQAIEEIAAKMIEAKAKYGPTAILHSYDYASGGLLKELDQRFFNYFGGMTKVIGSLCWGAGIQAQLYDFGNSKSSHVNDVINAKTIVVWGRNVTTTNMHLFSFIKAAKENGTRLIVIDPTYNGIAKQADDYLAINPGTDGLLALVISKVIVENNWYDHQFVERYTVGFKELTKQLKQLDIDKISTEIGLDKDKIIDLAKLYSHNKPVMTFLGLGMQRYENGGNTIRAIDALVALSGNIGIKGGGVNYANLPVGQSFNWSELLREDLRTAYRTFTRPSQAEEILIANDPPIKVMFISRSNAVTQLPYVQRTIEALQKVETKVVIDMYMTDTAKMADYVLPTTSVFEEEDIYYGSMFHGVVRYGPQIIEPPAEVKSDLEIWTELAKKLGLVGFIKSKDEFLKLALKPLNKYGIDLRAIKEKGEIELPLEKIPWQDYKFETPSGKFEFFSNQAMMHGINPIAIAAYPKESKQNQEQLTKGYPYHLLTNHPARSLHSQHHFLINQQETLILISDAIAEENGIANGDLLEVFNDRGQVEGRAKIQEHGSKSTIVIEEGHSIETKQNVNRLTSNGLSDMGNGSILYDCLVMIRKI